MFNCVKIKPFSIECRKTNPNSITYQLDYSANLKPQWNQNQLLPDYFRNTTENRSVTECPMTYRQDPGGWSTEELIKT